MRRAFRRLFTTTSVMVSQVTEAADVSSTPGPYTSSLDCHDERRADERSSSDSKEVEWPVTDEADHEDAETNSTAQTA